ncbi:MAG: ion transporter [Desulfuromonas sp.]|nr:MAG: ion transporter [Desulfuromonas sp.]
MQQRAPHQSRPEDPPLSNWRARLHEIIFEADTPLGKSFDVALIAAIIASVIAVMLDSVATVRQNYGFWLSAFEWFFTLLFSIEYGLRLLSITRPSRYALSFYGIVDLLAILPTYLSLLLPGSQFLLTIRILRLLRVFRVFKLVNYLGAADTLRNALGASRRKIAVFLFTVMNLVVILGSLMYVIEGTESGFTSIPVSIYWAIVTLTTVGYGDISPQTPTGQVLASFIMIIGYGIIAVPTGIVTAELTRAKQLEISTQACPACSAEGHDPDARHCKFCGTHL